MAGNHEFQEYKTPGQVAELIGVSVPTLRKYSLMIEKATNNRYFERNQQNTRLYTQQNIDQLKELTKLSKSPDRTLQDVIAQLYTITSSKASAETPVTNATVTEVHKKENATTDLAPVAQFMNVLNTMQDTVNTQKQTIDALQQQIQVVQEQNMAILERLNQAQGIDDFEEGIRLPDEPQIHVTESSQPVPMAQKKDSLASAALDPELEHLEEPKEKVYKPRTLGDMQLAPEPKRHWWQRFLDKS